jgi:hypothetical protein
MKKLFIFLVFVFGSFVFADDLPLAKNTKAATAKSIENIVSVKICLASVEGHSKVTIVTENWLEDNVYDLVVKLKNIGYKVDYLMLDSYNKSSKVKAILIKWEN